MDLLENLLLSVIARVQARLLSHGTATLTVPEAGDVLPDVLAAVDTNGLSPAEIVEATVTATRDLVVAGISTDRTWPSPQSVRDYVTSVVDLSEFGGAPGGDGLTSAQIFRLFTAPERDAIFGLIQIEPLILQALMTMALTDARISLDSPDFLAFVQGLGPPPPEGVGYGVLTQQRLEQVLAGQPPE